jgi:hypothetical protein
MLKRRGQGQQPQIVFTSDFHELVRGDLLAGSCNLRYDPHRIVPAEAISGLPATQKPITAHVRLHPGGELWEGDMRFAKASRLVANEDPTGGGTMLEIEWPLREGRDEIECWFSYSDAAGGTLWDSRSGRNYWVRFPAHDLTLRNVEIAAQTAQPFDQFELEVESIPEVDSMSVRWRYMTAIGDDRQARPLSAAMEGAKKLWTLSGENASVASNTPLAFDLVYNIGEHAYTDDNQGTWYIVSRTV